MSMIRTVSRLGFFLPFVASLHAAQAFEVDGFRMHMSVDEAMNVARKLDQKARLLQFPESNVAQINVRKFGKFVDDTMLIRIDFCDDKLVEFRKHFPIRMDRLAPIVSGMIERYGNPEVKTESNSRKIEGPEGVDPVLSEYNSVEMHFEAGKNVAAYIAMAQIATRLPDKPLLFPRWPRGIVDVFQVYKSKDQDRLCPAAEQPEAENQSNGN